jgi:subfamily B ATP-binding cassette protein MsbA
MGLRWRHVATCVSLTSLATFLDGSMLLALIPISRGAAQGNFDFVWKFPLLRSLLPNLPRAAQSFSQTFVILALFVFLLGVARSITHFALNFATEYWLGAYSARLANFLYRRYLSFGKAYFDRQSMGRLAAVIRYKDDLLSLFRALLRLISETLVLVVYLVVMLVISWRLALVAVMVFPALHLIRRWIKRKTSKPVAESKAKTLRIAEKAFEVLRAIPLFRAFAKEARAVEVHASLMEQVRKADLQVSVYGSVLPAAQEVITLAALLVMLIMAFPYGLARVTLETLFVFFFVARLAMPRLAVFHDVDLEFAHKASKLRELFDIFNDAGKYILPQGSRNFANLEKDIRFDRLSFAYPDRAPVLHDVSFTLSKGEMTAIVGPSGAGKTTLASLLLRYYEAPPHTILLDGIDIREFTSETLRRNFSLVSQDVILLHDSLKNNLAFGLDNPVSDRDLQLAISDSCLDEVVEALPDGLETNVGGDGTTLSGGQRQRVAIARALLKKAPVLILDEATSSLDSFTERLVQQAIENAIRGCTSLVIAHRLSTIQHADKIVVLDEGRVVEQGSPRELLEQRGPFFAMWEAQKFD